MAERVVDGFEIIEIDAQYGELPAVAARKHRLQTLVQQHAIGQRGERIVMRHVGDARLGAFALGDVDGRDQRRRAAFIGEPLRINGDVDHGAGGGAVLPGAAGLIVGRERREVRRHRGIRGVVQRAQRHPQEGIAAGMSVMRDRGVVDRDNALVVESTEEHRHWIGVEQQAERRLDTIAAAIGGG
jgi:hypothetical protein